MKNRQFFGRDYFEDLLERIQEIRISERRAYRKIADIFEPCSCDYEKNSKTTKAFYAAILDALLPASGAAERPQAQSIYSKMINYAERTSGDGELLRMKNWLDILNSCIGEERRVADDRKI